jgi:hypothetical protein
MANRNTVFKKLGNIKCTDASCTSTCVNKETMAALKTEIRGQIANRIVVLGRFNTLVIININGAITLSLMLGKANWTIKYNKALIDVLKEQLKTDPTTVFLVIKKRDETWYETLSADGKKSMLAKELQMIFSDIDTHVAECNVPSVDSSVYEVYSVSMKSSLCKEDDCILREITNALASFGRSEETQLGGGKSLTSTKKITILGRQRNVYNGKTLEGKRMSLVRFNGILIPLTLARAMDARRKVHRNNVR